MSRKPVNKLRPDETRDAVWREIKSQAEHGSFSAREIAHGTRLGVSTVRDYLTGLCNAGYLSPVERPMPESFQAQYYRLERDCGIDAPRVRKDGSEVTMGRGREQMWRTMRILKEFSAADLAFNSSTDEHQVAEGEAKDYCGHLYKAGYLVASKPHQPGKAGQTRYRLLPSKFTGPKPPMIQRVKQVYDPNLRQVVWAEDGGVHE